MCHLNILLAGLKHNVDELLVGVLKQILLRQVFQIHKYKMNKHTNAIHLQIQLHNTGGGSANSTNNQDLIFSKVMKKKSFTKPVHQTFHFYQICIFHLDVSQRPSNQIQSNPWITSYLLPEFENVNSSSSPPWFGSPGWLTIKRHQPLPSRWKRERLSSDDALAGSLARLWSLSGWRGWVGEIWWNHFKMWRWSFWRWSSSGQRCWRCACRQRRRWWPSPARIFTSSRKAFDKVCSNSDL